MTVSLPRLSRTSQAAAQGRLILEAGRIRCGAGAARLKLGINPASCVSIGLTSTATTITLVVLDFVGRSLRGSRARCVRETGIPAHLLSRAFVIQFDLRRQGISRDRWSVSEWHFGRDHPAHLQDQPGDYAAWAVVKVDELIRDVLRVPCSSRMMRPPGDREMQFGSGPSVPQLFLHS